MSRTFKDIFICETSWIYEIIKTQKILDSYSWFLDNKKYQITTSVHQASEKYFKYKLFEKYKLKDTIKFSSYKSEFEETFYNYLNGLRVTHNLQDLFDEVEDILKEDIKIKFNKIATIFSDSYIDLRYPNTNGDSVDKLITKEFLKDLITYLNVLYSETGCSGLPDSKKFFRELKETAKAKKYYKNNFANTHNKSVEVENKSEDLLSAFD